MKRLILTIALLAAIAGYGKANQYIVFSMSGRVTVGGKAVSLQQRLDGQQSVTISHGAFVTLLDPATRNLCTIGEATGVIAQLFNARKYSFRKIAQQYVDYIQNGKQHPDAHRSTYRQTAGAVTRQPYWATTQQQ
mgnify:CR=1 FL=1